MTDRKVSLRLTRRKVSHGRRAVFCRRPGPSFLAGVQTPRQLWWRHGPRLWLRSRQAISRPPDSAFRCRGCGATILFLGNRGLPPPAVADRFNEARFSTARDGMGTANETRERLRAQMPAAQRWAYFDHAAMSPLPRPTAEAFQKWLTEAVETGNPKWAEWVKGVETTRSDGGQDDRRRCR